MQFPPNSTTPTWQIRPLTPADLAAVLHVQTVCYGADFLESSEVFTRRLACAHQCSLGVVREGEAALQAYLLAYWSNPGKVTPLDGDFAAPHEAEPVLYLHDMSVLPAVSGQGLARRLVRALFDEARARGVREAALVSVQGSQDYWARLGFVVQPLADAAQQANLASYGAGAVYMVAAL